MGKRIVIVALLFFWLAPFAQAGCGWRDGMDSNAPPNDPGRGISDWRMHFDYVAVGKGMTDAHRIIGERFASLRACLPREAYARLYADVSVMIASVGRQSAGWLNALDGAAPPDDPGRGISRWQAHYDYVASGPGMSTVNRFVTDRLGTLSQKLSREGHARLYADLSIILANYARMDW